MKPKIDKDIPLKIWTKANILGFNIEVDKLECMHLKKSFLKIFHQLTLEIERVITVLHRKFYAVIVDEHIESKWVQ